MLGATGMVGQRFVQLLRDHPRFELTTLAASDRSAGRPYADASPWRLDGDPPHPDLVVVPCTPDAVRPRLVFSALDSGVAGPVEAAFRDAGHVVVSNASAHRLTAGVPLLIPEINPSHLDLVANELRAGRGAVVCNPNCTSVPLTVALAPLHRTWGVAAVVAATWQAVSGAGWPGESAFDMLGSVHPHAGDEEEKVALEPGKILGELRADGHVEPAAFTISARCVRVPVVDGHLVSASIRFRGPTPPIDEILAALRELRGPVPLHSSPDPLVRLTTRRDRPAPRPDADAGGGMAITVGRVEPCAVMGVKLYALAHNAIRGAAGGAIANAELIDAAGLLR